MSASGAANVSSSQDARGRGVRRGQIPIRCRPNNLGLGGVEGKALHEGLLPTYLPVARNADWYTSCNSGFDLVERTVAMERALLSPLRCVAQDAPLFLGRYGCRLTNRTLLAVKRQASRDIAGPRYTAWPYTPAALSSPGLCLCQRLPKPWDGLHANQWLMHLVVPTRYAARAAAAGWERRVCASRSSGLRRPRSSGVRCANRRILHQNLPAWIGALRPPIPSTPANKVILAFYMYLRMPSSSHKAI